MLRSGTASGGSVDMLVCSQSAYFVGQACFTDFGLAPADYDVVVVKSPNGANPHFRSPGSDRGRLDLGCLLGVNVA